MPLDGGWISALLVASFLHVADTPLSFSDAFGSFGFKIDEQVSTKSCRVSITLDRQVFIQMIPTLQKLQILNPEITQTLINVEPTLLAGAFLIQSSDRHA